MLIQEPLDVLPLWGLGVATLAVVLVSLEGGFRLGRWRRAAEQEKDEEQQTSVGAIVGATLGLLAFMLAITYQTAESRFDTRRSYFLQEVNAIGTTWLRADLLPAAQRTASRELLLAYVDTRLEATQPGKLEAAIERAEQLHRQLWAQAVSAGQAAPDSEVTGLYIESLNEVIDLQTQRVTAALRSRIPKTIWAALYAVTVLAMVAVGYHAGMGSRRRSLAVLVLAAAFSAVILLIADLDRPREGLLTVNQQPMIELRASLAADAGGR